MIMLGGACYEKTLGYEIPTTHSPFSSDPVSPHPDRIAAKKSAIFLM
jgi:hypothetical protein